MADVTVQDIFLRFYPEFLHRYPPVFGVPYLLSPQSKHIRYAQPHVEAYLLGEAIFGHTRREYMLQFIPLYVVSTQFITPCLQSEKSKLRRPGRTHARYQVNTNTQYLVCQTLVCNTRLLHVVILPAFYSSSISQPAMNSSSFWW